MTALLSCFDNAGFMPQTTNLAVVEIDCSVLIDELTVYSGSGYGS